MPDHLTPKQRSLAMQRVKLKDGSLERLVQTELRARGLRFKRHVGTLPGRPDIVFSKEMVAIFIDGDFWHGYRFPIWEDTLQEFWKKKIRTNRKRDQRNFRKLRRMEWRVVRIWQHQINDDLQGCIDRIIAAINREP